MISILKQGTMSFNQACCREYLLGFKYINFLYDRVKKRIGLKLMKEATDNAYPIRFYRKGTLANVSAMSFLKFYKIDHGTTKSYRCSLSKEHVVEVDLEVTL